jgi:hypothetical protein
VNRTSRDEGGVETTGERRLQLIMLKTLPNLVVPWLVFSLHLEEIRIRRNFNVC